MSFIFKLEIVIPLQFEFSKYYTVIKIFIYFYLSILSITNLYSDLKQYASYDMWFDCIFRFIIKWSRDFLMKEIYACFMTDVVRHREHLQCIFDIRVQFPKWWIKKMIIKIIRNNLGLVVGNLSWFSKESIYKHA